MGLSREGLVLSICHLFVHIYFLPIIIFAALIPVSCAHIPVTGEGYGLRDAVVISDPLKSWVVYTEYKDARPLYYQFNLSSGERLKAGL